MTFVLHERLDADTVAIAEWPLCRVLLMNDATWPWLILVPRRPAIREIHHLGFEDRQALMEETARAAQAMERLFAADKINVAALGNVVPQLHVHIIARHTTDPSWPRPIWGTQPGRVYGAGELAEMVERLKGL